MIVARDLEKLRPRGNATVSVWSLGASRPAATVNDSFGRAPPTPVSDTRDSDGLLWIVHGNATRAVVPPASDTLTVTVEVPSWLGCPVILPLDALMDRPAGRPAAL